VLLSLVRTESVGHIRDIRRLVVALSRARLGLYIFCRKQLFENCIDISAAFKLLNSKPSTLQLVPGEAWPTSRQTNEIAVETPVPSHNIGTVIDMGVLVYQMVQQAQDGPQALSNQPVNEFDQSGEDSDDNA
jgi:intron-binding protein aquarius